MNVNVLVILAMVVGLMCPRTSLARGRQAGAYRIVEQGGRRRLLRGGEKPAVALPGLIREGGGARIRFTAPQAEGPYRLFVQVLDGQGHVGYANTAFYVRQQSQ